jgi:hypothetical protein
MAVAVRELTRDLDLYTCMVFSNSEPVYTSPNDSRIVSIHKVRIASGHIKRLPANTLMHKAMCYAQFSTDYLVFIQLLHTV